MAVTRQPVPAGNYSQGSEFVDEAGPRSPFLVPGVGLVLIAALTLVHGSWAAQLVLVPLLLIVPGLLLLQALRVPGDTIALNPMYVPAAGLLVLLGSGLAVDLAGPAIGISAPLRTVPLLIGLELVCVALLLCSLNAPQDTRIPWEDFPRPLTLAWPFVLPLLGAAGALRLNSGHGDNVAVLAATCVLVALIAGFLYAPRCDDSLLAVLGYAAGLAMMWSFSLRGDLVYGFDISNEYHSMSQTVAAGSWHFSHPNDAYGAMLSVTVLPTELHELSGVPALFIFKVVYPAIGALIPVAVFYLARRVITGRWAFMTVALLIMQQTFFQQMPALDRQEVATVLFAVLIAVVLDTSLPRRSRFLAASLLSLGVVLSHYSTAYMAIPLFAMAVAFQWIVSWFRDIPRLSGAVLLACVVAIAGWPSGTGR